MATEVLSSKLVLRHYGPLRSLHEHWCPGCENTHQIAVKQPFKNGAQWTFDGNAQAPTFAPSVNVAANFPKLRCHYFIRAGKIEFCGDCHHDLRGKTVELPDIPPDWLE